MNLDDQEFDVVGDVLGVSAPQMARRPGAMIMVQKPGWRQGQLAPGLNQPQEGLVPLPLAPSANGGVFDVNNNFITFQGQLQKPFRGERILTSVTHSAGAPGRLLTKIWVGTNLMQADIQGVDIELLGNATAFGTRLTLMQAPPGVLIRFEVTITPPITTTTDTIVASMMLLGRIVH
jgi:hypothetical protein